MRKILLFLLLFFVFGVKMVWADLTPGDGGIPAPNPFPTPAPQPLPTGGGPVPTYPPGVSVPWCLKCNKNIPNRDPFISVGKIDYSPLSHSTTWQREPTEKYYRDKNWFCPNVWTAWNSIDGLIDEMKKVYASNSKIWREMSAFMHACQGDQVICADKSNPSNSNTCKSLKCDIFGVCDWDGGINNCCANTIDLEADCKSVLFSSQVECEMRYGTCHIDEYACKYGGGSVGSEPEPTMPEPEPTASPSLTEFWVRDETFVGRKRCCDFNSFGLCTEEEYRSKNRDKNKFLCQNCENEDEEIEDAFCFRSHKFCEWDDYTSKLVKALPIWISNCGTTYPVYGSGGFSGYMSNQDSCGDDWLGIHMDMWSCKTQTGSSARCLCDSAKPFSSPPSSGSCCVDKCGIPGIYWDDSDSFGCCWSWESANRTPSDEIYGICGGKTYYNCDESEGVYQCNKFTHDTLDPPVPDCLDEGTCFETLTGCQENCGKGMSIVPPVKISPNDGSLIEADSFGRNHICELKVDGVTPLFSQNRVRFSLTLQNGGNAERIDAVALALSHDGVDDLILTAFNLGNTLGPAGIAVTSGVGIEKVSLIQFDETNMTGLSGVLTQTVQFLLQFDPLFPPNLNYLWVSAMDDVGRTMPWTYTGRSFKAWDCKVKVEGAIYDGSSGTTCQAGDGFVTLAEGLGLTELMYSRNIDLGTEVSTMVVDDNIFSSDVGVSWGYVYNPRFNDDLEVDPAEMISRTRDVGGTVVDYFCQVSSQMIRIGDSEASPYASEPKTRIEYSATNGVNPDPWYQVLGGGVNAKGSVTNNVPQTCYNAQIGSGTCIAAVTSENSDIGVSNNGWVTAVGGGQKGCTDCSWGYPNNWTLSTSNFVPSGYSYNNLFNAYHVKLGLGETRLSGTRMTNLGSGATGVYFIDGDFVMDDNNTLQSGEYLMIIAKNRIYFDQSISSAQGIFLAQDDILAQGEGASQLIINGSIYSMNGDISFTRNFTNHTLNRTAGAVVVKYNPNFWINLPGALIKTLSNWRQGI